MFSVYDFFKARFDQNEMLWDLGMDVGAMDNADSVRKEIFTLQIEFDLVLITERFDESLIVLKDIFCWSMDDIMYLMVI